MGDIEKLKKTFDGMVQMLKFTSDETPKILDKNAVRPLERHLKAMESHTDEIHGMKLEIQKQMIQKGDKMEDVQKWRQETDDHMAVYEEIVEEIDQKIKTLKERERDQERRREEEIEEVKRQVNMIKSSRIEEAKQKMKQDMEKQLDRTQERLQTQAQTRTFMQSYQSWSLPSSKELIWIGSDFGISSRQKSTRQR
eukprot:Seg2820.3 transcript_id=Seg2820.3/GoldUCD/mRNA.D3Y31 product="hypothetical protein" protein_id=Seg2820.3/GoldUCD/D3Y31